MLLDFIIHNYVGIMLILAATIFLISGFHYLNLTKQLKKFTSVLLNASEKEEGIEKRIFLINEDIENKEVKARAVTVPWNRFYKDYNSNHDEYIPDPLFYFNEDQIVFRHGFRKMIEAIPAIFVSLGILGTFVGITTGISDINTNDGAEGLQEGINTLLSGMKFAFYSSIAGIIISLAFQVYDRFLLFKPLMKNTDKLLFTLDNTIQFQTESSLLDKMVKTQEAQLNDMRSFFTDEFIPLLTSGISETVSSTLNPHLEKSNEIMDKVAQNTMEAQSDTLNKMVDHFIESLNQVTGDHIKDLGDALHRTVEWQEKVHHEMSELVEELSNVAQKQAEMARNTTELSGQMNEYTETLSVYQQKLSSTTEELNAITKENTSMLNTIRETFAEMTDKHQEEEERFVQRIEQMGNTVEKISYLGSTISNLQEEMKVTMESLNQASDSLKQNIENNQELNERLISQHKLSNEWSVKTHELLENVAQNSSITEAIQINLENLYENITAERESLDSMQSNYSSTLTDSVQNLSELWKHNNELLTNNREQFSELNDSLSNSMEAFADHMHRGVQGTFEQFDVELQKAIQHISRGVSGIEQIIDSMEQDIDGINGQMARFNQSIESFNTGLENRMMANE